MNASSFIAGRLRFQGKMAIGTIAISFLIIISAISIASGFRNEIRKGVSAVSGDIQLTPPGQSWLSSGEGISSTPSFLNEIQAVEGVDSITPVIYHAGMIKEGTTIQGALFKGIPSLSGLEVSLPSELSKKLGLGAGDRFTAYFATEDRLKARKFTVRDVYRSILAEDDKQVILAGLSDLQRLEGWDSTTVSALEISLHPGWNSPSRMAAVKETVGMTALTLLGDNDDTLMATSAADRFSQLFSWLDLIDFNVVFIIALMVLVAGINMISALLILIFRNISTIGLLKTMGMADKQISAVFIKSSAALVARGMILGNALAFGFCLLQGSTHMLTLNPENYFVSFVPVSMNIPGILLADAAAFLAILALLLIPTLLISRIDPATTVKAD